MIERLIKYSDLPCVVDMPPAYRFFFLPKLELRIDLHTAIVIANSVLTTVPSYKSLRALLLLANLRLAWRGLYLDVATQPIYCIPPNNTFQASFYQACQRFLA